MAHTETYHSVGNGGRMCRKTNNRFLHIGPNRGHNMLFYWYTILLLSLGPYGTEG